MYKKQWARVGLGIIVSMCLWGCNASIPGGTLGPQNGNGGSGGSSGSGGNGKPKKKDAGSGLIIDSASSTNSEGGVAGDGSQGSSEGGNAKIPCSMRTDQAGCPCGQNGQMQSCYPGPAGTEGVGTCKAGMQVCMTQGEFGTWGPCMGAVTPQPEDCTNMIDTNCNGLKGCADQECVSLPACNMELCGPGIMVGATRPCYDGPKGTEGVGPCKAGTQTCMGQEFGWSKCMGEVVPTATAPCLPPDAGRIDAPPPPPPPPPPDAAPTPDACNFIMNPACLIGSMCPSGEVPANMV